MTVPDLPVEAPRPVRLLFDHQFGSASLTQRPTDTAAAATAFRTGATGHPAASPAGLLPLCSHRHGAGLHRTATRRQQLEATRAAPGVGDTPHWTGLTLQAGARRTRR